MTASCSKKKRKRHGIWDTCTSLAAAPKQGISIFFALFPALVLSQQGRPAPPLHHLQPGRVNLVLSGRAAPAPSTTPNIHGAGLFCSLLFFLPSAATVSPKDSLIFPLVRGKTRKKSPPPDHTCRLCHHPAFAAEASKLRLLPLARPLPLPPAFSSRLAGLIRILSCPFICIFTRVEQSLHLFPLCISYYTRA